MDLAISAIPVSDRCIKLSAQPIILSLFCHYCLNSLILLHLHTLYIAFSIVLLTVRLFIPCVTVVFVALLYLGQVTVVNENFFSTGLPG